MNKALGNLIKLIIFLGLGIFLVWLITHKLTPLQWQRIHDAARAANYWLLIPICFIGFLSFLFRALRWRLLLLPLGYRVGVFTIYSSVVVGYLANLAIPRMGEVTRCGMLARYERLPVDKVIGTMIVERTFDVICLALLMAVTILWQIDTVGDFFYDNVLVKIAALFRYEDIGSLLLWLAVGLIGCIILWLVLRRFRQSDWYRRLSRLLGGIKTGFVSVARLRQKKLFLVYTGLIWLCYFLMVYIGFYCFKETAALGTKAALSVLIFGSIGMILTQGGIGAYQLIVERVLLLYGVAKAYGFAFGWLSWLSQTGLILILGFASLLVMPFVKRKVREPGSAQKVTDS
jgi:uncharacterized protein (TIRG00374 family)